MKVTIIPIVIGSFDSVTKWLLKCLEYLEVGGRVENPNDSIIENGQNTEKNSGDFRGLVSPKLQWKTIS